ncbi:putative hydrolase C7D4.05 [Favolaschia claudopus]|uniref:Hydrolase C7D4.05 n=1 Tax=Favolaschia claudopus TaxID=2862362 RepID=A0AAW0DY86_9AGAR
MKIRLVSFDLLHTLITPRYPIHVQYARVFEPYLGPLNPDAVRSSFHVALKQLRAEKPVYGNDSSSWWSDVIQRTALGAGADPKVLNRTLSSITPRLMKAFSSREGYEEFDDSLSVLNALKDQGIRTAVVSNADARMLSVLEDLEFPPYLRPIVLSETEGVEKPSPEIFDILLQRVNDALESEPPISPAECLHVGDELTCDYYGAESAGFHALLLDRPGADHQQEATIPESVNVAHDLHEVLNWMRAQPGR